MDISIIIPVKDEEKTITQVLRKIHKHVKYSYEILIIYDDPSDKTIVTANKYINDSNVKHVSFIRNSIGSKKGVVNAIKTGIKQAKGKAIIIAMGDLSDDLSQIDTMYKMINQGNDIVAASRYMPGGVKVGGPFFKSFLSRSAGLSLHWLFKLPTHDATNAYKMYRRSIFQSISIESTGGFEYSLEITIKAFKKGFKIAEIPTVWHDDLEGKSHFRLFNWLPKYIKTYLLIVTYDEKKSHKMAKN